jgi:hypothetical protein
MTAVMCDRGITSLDRFVDRITVARLVWWQLTAKATASGHHEATIPWNGQAHEKFDFAYFDTTHFAMCGERPALDPTRSADQLDIGRGLDLGAKLSRISRACTGLSETESGRYAAEGDYQQG